MRTALLSLFAVAALAISSRSAEASPPWYSHNYGGYSNSNSGAYYYGNHSGYWYPNNYYQNYSAPAYSYPYYPNGSLPPSTSYYGPSGRGGALHPAPMSWRNGGNGNWNGNR